MRFRNKWIVVFLASLVLALGSGTQARAGDKKNPATTPTQRLTKDKKPDLKWINRHNGFLEAIAKNGRDVKVLFLGDSITDGWRGKAAQPTWDKYFAPLKSFNFGIGGDRTEHVLWRIQHGELDGIKPKVVVLMIGTNNTGSNSAGQIAEGITAIVKEIRSKSPHTKVLLLAVFPRGQKADNPGRNKIAEINKTIAKLDDGKNVKYLDIGQKFTQPDGSLTKEIMPDYLHLSTKGYQIWGDAIAPTIQALVKD